MLENFKLKFRKLIKSISFESYQIIYQHSFKPWNVQNILFLEGLQKNMFTLFTFKTKFVVNTFLNNTFRIQIYTIFWVYFANRNVLKAIISNVLCRNNLSIYHTLEIRLERILSVFIPYLQSFPNAAPSLTLLYLSLSKSLCWLLWKNDWWRALTKPGKTCVGEIRRLNGTRAPAFSGWNCYFL